MSWVTSITNKLIAEQITTHLKWLWECFWLRPRLVTINYSVEGVPYSFVTPYRPSLGSDLPLHPGTGHSLTSTVTSAERVCRPTDLHEVHENIWLYWVLGQVRVRTPSL